MRELPDLVPKTELTPPTQTAQQHQELSEAPSSPSPPLVPPPPSFLTSLKTHFLAATRAVCLRRADCHCLDAAKPSLVLLAAFFAVALQWTAEHGGLLDALLDNSYASHYTWLTSVVTILGLGVLLATGVSGLHAARPSHEAAMLAETATDGGDVRDRLSLASLFTVATLTSSLIYVASLLLALVADRITDDEVGLLTIWVLPALAIIWWLIANIVLFSQSLSRRDAHALALCMLLLVGTAIFQLTSITSALTAQFLAPPLSENYTAPNQYAHLHTGKLLAQARVLDRTLTALPAQRPGVIDAYVITYSPYAAEDVFLKEGELVTKVLGERFGTAERSIRLVNHRSTMETHAWATPDNLKIALEYVGKLIDPAEDIVILHLASHGGKDGKLSAEFWPLQTDTLTSQAVRDFLNAANIPVSLISVSACYSGTWIAPLRSDSTMVMTAADAGHTSYGCGTKSELTYFTRAVFAEQLATQTRSFEAAFAAARPIIDAREKEAGKKDGFSNPQIHIGHIARERIQRWEQQAAGALPQ